MADSTTLQNKCKPLTNDHSLPFQGNTEIQYQASLVTIPKFQPHLRYSNPPKPNHKHQSPSSFKLPTMSFVPLSSFHSQRSLTKTRLSTVTNEAIPARLPRPVQFSIPAQAKPQVSARVLAPTQTPAAVRVPTRSSPRSNSSPGTQTGRWRVGSNSRREKSLGARRERSQGARWGAWGVLWDITGRLSTRWRGEDEAIYARWKGRVAACGVKRGVGVLWEKRTRIRRTKDGSIKVYLETDCTIYMLFVLELRSKSLLGHTFFLLDRRFSLLVEQSRIGPSGPSRSCVSGSNFLFPRGGSQNALEAWQDFFATMVKTETEVSLITLATVVFCLCDLLFRWLRKSLKRKAQIRNSRELSNE